MGWKKSVFLICLGIGFLGLIGCSNLTKPDNRTVSLQYIQNFPYANNVELAQYKGLLKGKVDTDFSEKEIQEEIKWYLMPYAKEVEVQNRGAQKGDIVYFDYIGTVVSDDSHEIIKDEDCELDLGSGYFLPEFEEQLLGSQKHETKEITVSFPKEFEEEQYAGKTIEFLVSINKIIVLEVPELTDNLVRKISEYDSVEDYRNEIKQQMKKDVLEVYEFDTIEKLIDEVTSKSRLISYNPFLLVRRYAESKADFTAQAELYGVDVQEIIAVLGIDDCSFTEFFLKSFKKELVITAIAKRENLFIKDNEYEKVRDEYLKKEEYKSLDEYLIEGSLEDLELELLEDRVGHYLLDQAKSL